MSTSTRGEFIRAMGLGLAGGAVALSIDSKASGQVAEEPVSVTDYGATGAESDADQAGIEAAIATGAPVFFPPGRYRVRSTVRVRPVGGRPQRLLFAHPGTATLVWAGSGAGVMFDVQTHKVGFAGLSFEGTFASQLTCLRFARQDNNRDDMDGSVHNCVFVRAAVAIKIVGRGLSVTSTTFANGGECIVIDWPTEGVQGSGPGGTSVPNDPQLLPFGLRAFSVVGNRMHSCDRLVSNLGTSSRYLSGLVLADNQVDVGNALFAGGLRYGTITGNVVSNTHASPLYFTYCDNTVIANNILSGRGECPEDPAPTQNCANENVQPNTGINFGTDCTYCRSVSIVGNSLSNIEGDGIVWAGAVQSYVTIQGNTFNNIGWNSPATRGCLRFATNANDFAIGGNTFISGLQGCATMIRVASSNVRISGFEVHGNAFQRNRTLFTPAFTDGGFNSIQTL
jgi:parallel beta-helix repeat protein